MNRLLQFSNLVYLTGLLSIVVLRSIFEKRVRQSDSTYRQLDGQEASLMAVFVVGVFVIPFVYLFSSFLVFVDYSAPWFMVVIGSGVMLSSIWLFWRAHVDLGSNFSMTLEIRKHHQIVKAGVYRYIRHPMYASIWLWTIAQAMLLHNWLAGFAALLAFAPLYYLRVPREEQMMIDRFRKEYSDYQAQTGKVVPRILFRPFALHLK